MAYLTLALQGASTALGVVGALHKGETEAYRAQTEAEMRARNADAQAEADEFNSKVARQLADYEHFKAKGDVADFRRSQNKQAAQSRAVFAASGLALEGSPLMVDEMIFQEIDFGASRIAAAAGVVSTRYRNQAQLLDLSARRNRETAVFAREAGKTSAENIRSGSFIDAIGTGIRGFADVSKTLSGMPGGWSGTTPGFTPYQRGTDGPLVINRYGR